MLCACVHMRVSALNTSFFKKGTINEQTSSDHFQSNTKDSANPLWNALVLTRQRTASYFLQPPFSGVEVGIIRVALLFFVSYVISVSCNVLGTLPLAKV